METPEQRRAVCHTLMRVARLSYLWPMSGPTPEAVTLLEEDGGHLSPGERVMLLATFSLWNGDERLRFSELARLSPANLFAVGSLVASRAVDRMQPPQAPRPYVAEWITDELSLVG